MYNLNDGYNIKLPEYRLLLYFYTQKNSILLLILLNIRFEKLKSIVLQVASTIGLKPPFNAGSDNLYALKVLFLF